MSAFDFFLIVGHIYISKLIGEKASVFFAVVCFLLAIFCRVFVK